MQCNLDSQKDAAKRKNNSTSFEAAAGSSAAMSFLRVICFSWVIPIFLYTISGILGNSKETKAQKDVRKEQPECGEIPFDREALLALYSQTESRIRSHRETLWQQVRHFSWLTAIILTAAAYIFANALKFVAIVWILPPLMLLSIGVGYLARSMINQERREFLRAVLVTRKIEKLLGLHEPVRIKELSRDKMVSGYLFRPAHIDVFKKIEKLGKGYDEEDGERRWIEWRIERKLSPFDYYGYIFIGQMIVSGLGFLYSLHFVYTNFELYLPPIIK